MAVVRQGEGRRRGNGFRAGLIGAPALGRQVFQADERALFGMLHGVESPRLVCQRLNVGLAQRNDLIPGKALGVEDGQTVTGRAQGGHALLLQPGDLFFHGGVFLLGDFIDLMDAGTGQNIVELVDEHALPETVGLFRRIGEQPAGQHGQ